VLKPDPFDGKNFLIWKVKMELWLSAMSCLHAAEGKPADLPPEDEAKFMAEDNLFQGAVISALDTKFQKSNIILPVEELIGTLDVEERARTKDSGKGVETSTANVVQKRNFYKFNKKKK
jgi:hypothetical protein